MTVLIAGMGLMLGLFAVDNNWFDTRPHYYTKTYQSDKACNHASIQLEKTTGRVCVPQDNHSGHVDLYTTRRK